MASALDRKQLVKVLGNTPGSGSFPDAKVIDVTGWEFWFHSSHKYLAPGLPGKRWTKKQLIELYNLGRRQSQELYLPRSLQNFKLERVVADIAHLLNLYDNP